MSDLIFKTNGKEGFRIPFPTPGTRCPETKLEVKQMTDFQPTPQTPEQVDEGLRNAFRQAMKDGVMDATPYLKQMTYKSDIEKTEAEIKVLQKKLELLKEIETHKSQPIMVYVNEGGVEIVSYNNETYYRLDLPDEVYWYISKRDDNGAILLKQIIDGETHRLLEGVWFNDVKKGKYDDVVDEHKSPVEEAYKDWWGIYPELENDTEYDETRWSGFQAGYEAAQLKDVGIPECPDEPEHYDEVEWDEKDNPASYITDEVVNRMVRQLKSKKLWHIMRDKLEFSMEVCDEIVDAVEEWLPKEQSAAGSQNVNTELLVDGFNDCLRKMKEMLR